MIDWVYQNEVLLWWLFVISVVSFCASMIVIPLILALMPADYFISTERHRVDWSNRHPVLRLTLKASRFLLGSILILMGIILLALPGQGILTILIGLMLIEFPGKYTAERWLISRHSVFRSVNWFRRKLSRPELMLRGNGG